MAQSPPYTTDFPCIARSQQHLPASPWLAEAYECERAFLQRAQDGESIRDEVLIYLQPRVKALATRMYTHLVQSLRQGNVIEASDLVNTANVAILASYDAAFTKENPFGYLFKTAKVAMIHYLNGRAGHAIATRAPGGPVPVLSLDMPGRNGQCLADLLAWELRLPAMPEQQRFCTLQQALEELPEKQRKVIQHYFGLDGNYPVSLNEISRQFFSRTNGARTGSARRHYKRGLATLRQILATQFPQYTSHQPQDSCSRSAGGAQ